MLIVTKDQIVPFSIPSRFDKCLDIANQNSPVNSSPINMICVFQSVYAVTYVAVSFPEDPASPCQKSTDLAPPFV